MRLARSEVKRDQSNVGEVECLFWRDIKFSWSYNTDNIDYYTTKGLFVGLKPKYAYENLTIVADFSKKTFNLKTGRGKPITWINLLNY